MPRFANITDNSHVMESTHPGRPGYMVEMQLGGVFISFGPVGVLGPCTGHGHIPKTENLGCPGGCG